MLHGSGNSLLEYTFVLERSGTRATKCACFTESGNSIETSMVCVTAEHSKVRQR